MPAPTFSYALGSARAFLLQFSGKGSPMSELDQRILSAARTALPSEHNAKSSPPEPASSARPPLAPSRQPSPPPDANELRLQPANRRPPGRPPGESGSLAASPTGANEPA